jgi:hypothetical protein
MIFRIFITFLLLCFYQIIFAQGEANSWRFGVKAGIDFNVSPPASITTSAMVAGEGCASMSDTNGDLLFYTDGMNVWDKNNMQMPNGNGLTGCGSSTQSAIIVPQPDHEYIYYIFTANCGDNNPSSGFRYSIIDMNLNGGLGDITVKNVLLFTNTTEKNTAFWHSNHKDIWVLAHEYNTNNFRAYLLTASGLNTTAVISSIGSVHIANSGLPISGVVGNMKVSCDGKKIAAALYSEGECHYELFDFDGASGMLSNVASLILHGKVCAYGVEFSPDGSKLYASTWCSPSELFQFNLKAGSAGDIINSAVLLFSDPNYLSVSAIQNAPDGKIYVARSGQQYLGVINNPNQLGAACNYVDKGFILSTNFGGASSAAGLPNFLPFYFKPVDFIYSKTCKGDSTVFMLDKQSNIQSVLWDFGDPSSGVTNMSAAITPTHVFSAAGTYTVTATIALVGGAPVIITHDVVITPAPEVYLPADTLLCNGETLHLNVFQSGVDSYLWSTGSISSVITVTDSGRYSVTVTQNGCAGRDSMYIQYYSCCTDTIIPNLITPNEDGMNDTFYAGCIDKDPWVLDVYNRWSKRVYYNTDYKNQWKAEGMADGIYFVLLTKKGKAHYKGWVQVIR